MRWLDDGLRDGRHGRLEAEYPLSMHRGNLLWHRVVFEGARPLAHAMLHRVEVVARGRRLPLALIGNVYTDPAARGRGLASACIESCVDAAREMGIAVVALWSDLDSFYRRLGFHECGHERYLAVDSVLVERAVQCVQPDASGRTSAAIGSEGLRVGEALPSHFERLEGLIAAKPVHVQRDPGALERLAAAPRTELVVATRGERAVAYAAIGRGDDFEGVVHEWAGEDEGVLACLAHLCAKRERLLILRGPTATRAFDALEANGAGHQDASFARVRLLDAQRLWTAIGGAELEVRHEGERVIVRAGAACGPAGSGDAAGSQDWEAELSEAQALRFFFGSASQQPHWPGGASNPVPERVRVQLGSRLPWPLYVWGFDSI